MFHAMDDITAPKATVGSVVHIPKVSGHTEAIITKVSFGLAKPVNRKKTWTWFYHCRTSNSTCIRTGEYLDFIESK